MSTRVHIRTIGKDVRHGVKPKKELGNGPPVDLGEPQASINTSVKTCMGIRESS